MRRLRTSFFLGLLLVGGSARADAEDPYRMMAFNPKAREIAVDTLDELVLMKLDGGKVTKLEGSTERVSDVAFSGDGKRIVASFDRGPLVVWDAATGKKITSIKPREYSGFGQVALNGDGTLVAGAVDVKTWLYDVAGGSLIKKWDAGTGRYGDLGFFPNSRKLMLSNEDITVLDPGSDEPLNARARGTVLTAWSPSGHRLVGASPNGNFYTLNAADHAVLANRYENDSDHRALAITVSPDGKSILVLTEYGVDQLAIDSLQRTASWNAEIKCSYVAFAGGNLLGCADKEQVVRLYSLGGGAPKLVGTLQGSAATAAGAQRELCSSSEYLETCKSEKMIDYAFKSCRKAGSLDRHDPAKVQEWAEAVRTYPEARDAFARFKSKYESCYNDNHQCRIATDVGDCEAAGPRFKADYKSLVEGVVQQIDQASARVDQVVTGGQCGNSLNSALDETKAADKFLAQALELGKLPFLAGDAGDVEARVEKGRQEIKAKVESARKADDAKWQPYTSVLKGDRLKWFNENDRCGATTFTTGGRALSGPAALKSASVMCSASVDRNGLVPRWNTRCYSFKGDKMADSPRVASGPGETPPSSAYK